MVDDSNHQLVTMVLQGNQRLSGIAQSVVHQVVDAGTQGHRLHLQGRAVAAGLDVRALILGILTQ
ncbi:hypothetical protein D3C76_1514600 [compost metagenome]